MTITGKIEKIMDTQKISDSFSKREFVIKTVDGQYPQEILLEFTQDKCSLLDLFATGQDVTVQINLRGRKWTNPEGIDKYFNTIQAWKINKDTVQEATSNDMSSDSVPY